MVQDPAQDSLNWVKCMTTAPMQATISLVTEDV